MQCTQINPAKPLHHNLSSLATIYPDKDQISGIRQANVSRGSDITNQTGKGFLKRIRYHRSDRQMYPDKDQISGIRRTNIS